MWNISVPFSKVVPVAELLGVCVLTDKNTTKQTKPEDLICSDFSFLDVSTVTFLQNLVLSQPQVHAMKPKSVSQLQYNCIGASTLPTLALQTALSSL